MDLKKLAKAIEDLNQDSGKKRAALFSAAVKILASDLEKNEDLNRAIESVESSKELASTEDEFLSQWTRVDASVFIDTNSVFEKEVFQAYMDEFHIRVDFENDAFLYSIGPAIIINEDGDVLDQDSGKWIIDKKDYETESERNQLIEKWMEKNGYFPSVVSMDRYGNAFYVSTKEKKDGIE